jgi:MFS family permease
MVVNYAAVTFGQLLAAAGDPRGFELFALSCIGICAALVPVGLTTKVGPAPVERIVVRLGHLYRISPVGAVSAVLIGISSGAFGTLAAVFVSRIGFSTAEAALFVSAAILGAACMQLPAGYLSDRVDRRWLIIGLAICAALTGVWMTLSDGDGPAGFIARSTGIGAAATWIAGSFVFGAFAYPLYGVSVAHMNDHVEADGFVEASSGFMLLWSVGAMAGPFLAALAMSGIGPNALFLTTAMAHALLALFAVYRMTRRAAPSGEEKSIFVPTATVRTTQMVAAFDPRAPGDDQ